MPVGPPKNGTLGLTLPRSAGSILTSARSLKSQVLASFSPFLAMVIHELYTRVPGLLAPTILTGVPSGMVAEVQPLVSVGAPVPAQCAAWPMNTSVAL
jgi:hypothetical protein